MKDALRLDAALVDRGFFTNLKLAQSWIMSGKVLVDEVREDKPGFYIKKDQVIRVKGMECPYVSRGGLKLHGALDSFKIDVKNRVAIDCGACTGGFTDCLIKHGCIKVYAVEVGFGQLAGSLFSDERVINMEKMNIGDLTFEMLDPNPSLCVMDLSYLSLTKAVPIASKLLKADEQNGFLREIVALIKPLFEVKVRLASDITKDLYIEAIKAAKNADSNGLVMNGLVVSSVLGSGGTLEFLAHYKEMGVEISDDVIEKVVEEGMLLLSKS